MKAVSESQEPTLTAEVAVTGVDIAELRARDLLIPVRGVVASALASSFDDGRVGHLHEAIDILAPRGTDVLAVENGRIEKLFTSVAGGLTIYEFDPSKQFVYYYAHLDSYAPGIQEGDEVKRGDVIGFVGTTGNAPKNTPHLHFAIAKLGADHRWWGGTALDPFLVWRDPVSN
jgi:murein DD-endopeptidase MepM/ murein hydrolase activator NlpD